MSRNTSENKTPISARNSSKEGFWFTIKRNKKYVQCKSCGTEFLLCVIFTLEKQGKRISSLLREEEI